MSNNLKQQEINGVTFLGEVDNAVDFIKAHSIMVVPLFSGSGTRVKILEGLALKRAVVSTSLGKEGIDGEHGKHLFVADNPKDFAQTIIELIDDPSKVQQVGSAAYDFIMEHYDHANIARQLLDKYKALVVKYKKA